MAYARPMETLDAARVGPRDGQSDVTLVDPRAPRFGQSITTIGLVAGIALGHPLPIVLVAVVLAAAVLSGWRLDVYAVLWRSGARRFLGPPAEREPAAPHRFARVLGAVGTVAASGFVLVGFETAGYAVAGAVALAAGLAATTGLCLGCRLYRHVATFRRLGIV